MFSDISHTLHMPLIFLHLITFITDCWPQVMNFMWDLSFHGNEDSCGLLHYDTR
jgi:hypothetical protein